MNNKKIETLVLNEDIVNKLNNKNINVIKDLCILSRKDLKEIGLNNNEIKDVIIKLQLIGIDLNNKVYAKV